MSEDKNKKQMLDDFWDISSLVPEKKKIYSSSKSVSAVEITNGNINVVNQNGRLSEGVLIERFIPPHTAEEVNNVQKPYLCYIPENSLIHKVTVYKEKSLYEFYSEFYDDAMRLLNVSGKECVYADFFSYSPQYNQLTRAQLGYYLWWRDCVRHGEFIKTNTSYIYLYTFELINTASEQTAYQSREIMLALLKSYDNVLLGAVPKYIRWICDFSLVHKLVPPDNLPHKLLKSAGALKEYFIRIPGNTYEGWARALLDYCCSYDWRTSKFATEENMELFDAHVPAAITRVVKKLSTNGKILSGLPFGDCKIHAVAFEGALCSSGNRYTLEAEYCSFSRSHELRFLIGDAVKYAENKIRTYISVKSKLTVYSLPLELQSEIDAYFADAFPTPKRQIPKKEKREEYDVLYDLPKTVLSLSNAQKIENESWSLTRELIEAFDEPVSEQTPQMEIKHEVETDNEWGEYFKILLSIKNGDKTAISERAKTVNKPIEAVVDEINERSVEIIGDIILEESDGDYLIIGDYIDLIN